MEREPNTFSEDLMAAKITLIAEVGSVHDGSLGNALALIDAASSCGADLVKFQTHIASAETLKDAPMPPYFKGEPRYQYFQRTAFSLAQWRQLKDHCKERSVEFLSSPFSMEAVEILEELEIKRYKIPSGEVTNLPLLELVAQTKKPVILSSGMNSWEELDRAVEAVRKQHDRLSILQCTSEYPCPYEQVGLNVMLQMKKRYGLPVGLSDHTLTIFAPLAAAALGATIIEKHFTFSRLMYGSDAKHSLEPQDFREMVSGIRAVEAMLHHPVDKAQVARFSDMKRVFEKSLVSLKDISKGQMLTPEVIGIKKPGTGIPAACYQEVVGKKAARDIPAEKILEDQDIE
ncbi:MAG: N-acetylneuraminate synthase family protein [Desulfarculaceae bacterium]